MRCLYCGKRLSLLHKLSGREFCGDEHYALYMQDQESLGLARLIEAKQQYSQKAPANKKKSRRQPASLEKLPPLAEVFQPQSPRPWNQLKAMLQPASPVRETLVMAFPQAAAGIDGGAVVSATPWLPLAPRAAVAGGGIAVDSAAAAAVVPPAPADVPSSAECDTLAGPAPVFRDTEAVLTMFWAPEPVAALPRAAGMQAPSLAASSGPWVPSALPPEAAAPLGLPVALGGRGPAMGAIHKLRPAAAAKHSARGPDVSPPPAAGVSPAPEADAPDIVMPQWPPTPSIRARALDWSEIELVRAGFVTPAIPARSGRPAPQTLISQGIERVGRPAGMPRPLGLPVFEFRIPPPAGRLDLCPEGPPAQCPAAPTPRRCQWFDTPSLPDPMAAPQISALAEAGLRPWVPWAHDGKPQAMRTPSGFLPGGIVPALPGPRAAAGSQGLQGPGGLAECTLTAPSYTPAAMAGARPLDTTCDARAVPALPEPPAVEEARPSPVLVAIRLTLRGPLGLDKPHAPPVSVMEKPQETVVGPWNLPLSPLEDVIAASGLARRGDGELAPLTLDRTAPVGTASPNRASVERIERPLHPVLPRTSLDLVRENFSAALHEEVPRNAAWRKLAGVALQRFQAVPAVVRWGAMIIPLAVALFPYIAGNTPAASAGVVSGGGVKSAFAGRWQTFQANIMSRAAISLSEDFRAGLAQWDGAGNWAKSWAYDAAGFIRPGELALFRPTLGLEDYQFQFAAQLDSLTWVFRAADTRNYHAARVVVLERGPIPRAAIVRYSVVDGKKGKTESKEIPFGLRDDKMYQVRVDVRGSSFTTYLDGQVIDFFRDDRLAYGGIGFAKHATEKPRLRWVSVTHQYDMLGRLCAMIAPYDLHSAPRSVNQ